MNGFHYFYYVIALTQAKLLHATVVQVGVRGVEMVRNMIDSAESQIGLGLDNFDLALVAPSLMHQVGYIKIA
jgi:hypothetical protein